MAIAFDTTGAPFGLWQGGKTTGAELANETITLTWNEHLSWHFEAAKAFYRAVFRYEYHDVSGYSFRYSMLMVDGREVGCIGRYIPRTPTGSPAAWSLYFVVADTDAAVATAVEHGGDVVQPQVQPVRPHRRRRRQPGAVFSLISSPQA